MSQLADTDAIMKDEISMQIECSMTAGGEVCLHRKKNWLSYAKLQKYCTGVPEIIVKQSLTEKKSSAAEQPLSKNRTYSTGTN